MAAVLAHKLKVACLKNGASPTPVASRQPLALFNDTSLAGCMRQKRKALNGRIEARVSVAIGPLPASGALAVTAIDWPDQLPLQE